MKINDIVKRELIAYCIAQQQQTVATAQVAMQEAQREANEYGTPKDRYDGFRNQQLRKRDLQARQLQQALDNVAILQKIDAESVHQRVEFGAIIKTDKTVFFIAVGLGLIKFDGQELVVISTKVPIFEAMRAKTLGDIFMFNQASYIIQDII